MAEAVPRLLGAPRGLTTAALPPRAVWFQRVASRPFGFDRYNRRWHVDADPDAVEGATVEFPQGAATEAFFHDMRGCGNQPSSVGLLKSEIDALADVRPWPCRSYCMSRNALPRTCRALGALYTAGLTGLRPRLDPPGRYSCRIGHADVGQHLGSRLSVTARLHARAARHCVRANAKAYSDRSLAPGMDKHRTRRRRIGTRPLAPGRSGSTHLTGLQTSVLPIITR